MEADSRAGYGYHGDFMSGWDTALLDRVMADKSCTTLSATGGVIEECNTFTNENRLRTDAEMESCTLKPSAKLNMKGGFSSLPGCNTIAYGPAPATECQE